MKVSARALSVFCPHCQKRAALESLRIIGSHPARTLATCGDILIERTARLHLSVIGNNVVIYGHVRGPVVANETVEVGPTGHVLGDITAAKIIVRDGARIDGRCEMTRAAPPDPRHDSPPQHDDTPTTAGGALPPQETPDARPRRPRVQPRPLQPPRRNIKPVKPPI